MRIFDDRQPFSSSSDNPYGGCMGLLNIDTAFLAGFRGKAFAETLRVTFRPLQSQKDPVVVELGAQGTVWTEADKGGMAVQFLAGLRIQPFSFGYLAFWLGVGGGANERDTGHALSFAGRVGFDIFHDILSGEIALSHEVFNHGPNTMVSNTQALTGFAFHIDL
ncbi:MAG: hypothetical protein A3C46_08530 [Deltaproteobacteria bacterium RIFCSPHIGHO2_02_FULL_44_16]|nr:MAG: hypothetical protein A3C46_08530 [Deltaproteobacteria bacterium RIFCSPHIGHO2_02_FULL_44_16]